QSTENDDVFRRQLYIDFLRREKPPGSEAWISRVSVPEKHAPAQEPIKFVIDVNYNALPIILKDADGKELGSFTLPIVVPQPAPPQNSSPPNTESSSFQLPTLGQVGKPTVITGPFDGNSTNTSLNWSTPGTTVQDVEKNTGNVSGGFTLLAESPRKAVFRAPTNVSGAIEIDLKEGNKETKGTFRNVSVNLSAPK